MADEWLGDGPILIGIDTWVLMRGSKRIPVAVVQLIDRGARTEHYRVVSFAPESAGRRLLGRYRTLQAADQSVRFTVPQTRQAPPPNPPAPMRVQGGGAYDASRQH